MTQDGDKYRLTIKDLNDSDISSYRIVAGPHSSKANLNVASGKIISVRGI